MPSPFPKMESCGAEGSGVVFSEPLPDQVALAGVVLTELCPEDPRAARCLASWRTFACLRPHHSHMLSEKTLLVTVRPCDRQALLTHGRCQRFFQWGKLKPNHTSGTCTGLVAKEASFPLAILSNPGFTCICEFFYYYLCWELKTWLQMWMKLITKTVAKNYTLLQTSLTNEHDF